MEKALNSVALSILTAAVLGLGAWCLEMSGRVSALEVKADAVQRIETDVREIRALLIAHLEQHGVTVTAHQSGGN